MLKYSYMILLAGILLSASCATPDRPQLEFKSITNPEFQKACNRLRDCAAIISIWYIGSVDDRHFFIQSQVGTESEQPVGGYMVRGVSPVKNVIDLNERKIYLYSTNGPMKVDSANGPVKVLNKGLPPFETTEIHNKALQVKSQ